MIKKLLVISCCALVLFSCKQKTSDSNLKSELLIIADKLKTDKNHEFLKTLKPVESDFNKIFNDENAVEKAVKYSKNKWDFIDKLPEDVMKPKNEDDEVVVAMANKSQLEKLIYNGLSSDYASMAEFLREDIVVFGIHYINMNGMQLKSRAAFFNIEGRWIFIPNIFEAFI